MMILVSSSGELTALADEPQSEENVVYTEVNNEVELIAAIENGENVKFVADITLSDRVMVEHSLIVDLNGKTMTGAMNKKMFMVTGSGVEVKFTDSSENETGLLKGLGTSGGSIAISVENGANVIVEKGNYQANFSALNLEANGRATIKGGTFDGTDSYYTIFNENGNLNILDGTFVTEGNPIVRMIDGTTKVNSGEFYTTNTSITLVMCTYVGGTLDLSDFTGKKYRVYFEVAPSASQISIPSGYAWVDEQGNKVDTISDNQMVILVKTIKVFFNANGGSGVMESVETNAGIYELPKCQFTAPEGLGFLGWSKTPKGEEYTRYEYEVTEDTTLYAIWGIVYDVYVGEVGLANGDYLASGADKTTKAKPETGGYVYYKDGVLTLNDYVHNGDVFEVIVYITVF